MDKFCKRCGSPAEYYSPYCDECLDNVMAEERIPEPEPDDCPDYMEWREDYLPQDFVGY